jgi:hypothetical protein
MNDGDEGDDEGWPGRCPRCRGTDFHHQRKISEFDGDGGAEAFVEDDEERHCPIRFYKLTKCRVCGLGGVPRSHVKGGYFRREVLEVVDELPAMGKPCYHCGARIPKFIDLPREDEIRIFTLARSEGEGAAVDALVEVMSCPREWAVLWVTHPFGPRRPARLWVGPPCARCGRPLRTRLARQCFECGLDWHDRGALPQVG